MRLLLDTHTLLWWLGDSAQLGATARSCIGEGANAVFVSAASAWEIEIKRALRKLQAPMDVSDTLQASGFEPLPITLAHATLAGRLPPHHGDPFDRMLIAQAAAEQLLLVTGDGAFDAYGVALLDARS